MTGIHNINKKQAIDLMSNTIKEKLGITKGGINMFKYLFSLFREVSLNASDEECSMTLKVIFEDCRDAIGYNSTQSVWNGLAELLDKDIIARSAVPGVYFLNPNFFLLTETIIVTELYKLK
jgi:hypothetical protein